MRESLRKLFWPILGPFEKGDEPFAHKPLNRKILIAVGVLFMILCGVAAFFALNQRAAGYIAPVVVFFVAGAVCLIVGVLGNDRAVSKIWGNR